MIRSLALLMLMCCHLHAELNYIPSQPDPLANDLNWTRQEISDQWPTVSVTVTNEDSVWVAYEDGYVDHHGAGFHERYRIEYNGLFPRISSIFVSATNEIYAVSVEGVFYLDGNDWKLITTSLTGTLVTHPIIQTKDQRIWYTHDSGIELLDKDKRLSVLLTNQPVVSMCEVSPDKLWIIADRGESLYEAPRSGANISPKSDWKMIMTFPTALREGGRLFKDSDGCIWIINSSLYCGAIRYNPKTSQSETYNLSELGGDNYNNDIIQTPDGKIWISGRSFIHVFDGENWKIYDQKENIPSSFRMVIESDSKGFVYVVDGGNSLYRIDCGDRYWKEFQGLHFQDQSPNEDQWFLTHLGEVVKESNNNWVVYTLENQIIDSALRIRALSNGDVVCYGSHQGKAAISSFIGTKWKRKTFTNHPTTFSADSFLELDDGSFLLGLKQPDTKAPIEGQGGIIRFWKSDNEYHSEVFLPSVAPKNAINILQMEDGTFWSNYFGIESFSTTKQRQLYQPPGWYHNWVEQIAVTSDNTIWLSLWGMGIFSFSPEHQWTHHGAELGLDTKSTSQLITLQSDTLLTSTDRGLFRWDKDKWLPFLDRSITTQRDAGTLISNKNHIWINRSDSSWYSRWQEDSNYRAGKIQDSFVSLRYTGDKEGPVTTIISPISKRIETNQLRVEWQGVDSWSKTPAERLQYTYRLDDNEWSSFSAETSVTFGNLSGGHHTIEVKARDEDLNIDPVPARHAFIVALPIWLQKWFYITVGSVGIGIVILIIIIIRLKIKHIEELDELRNRFFINLSHELRTPLSLLSIPLERLRKQDLDKKTNKDLSLMELNVKRLVVLVDQLLDFRAIERGKLSINLQKIDLVRNIRELIDILEVQASEKNLLLSFQSSHASCQTNFDPDLLQKITENLLSNAIKYTPEGGQINLQFQITTEPKNQATLTIEDNGMGMTEDVQAHIFEPFYRAKSKYSNKGYGIGLALVKELLDVVDGQISVESPVFNSSDDRPGSRFTVNFPIEKPEILDLSKQSKEVTRNEVKARIEVEKVDHIDESKPVLLLVEDNLDLRLSLSEELEENYLVLTASNGEEGLQQSTDRMPDLIIADVMMPVLDGFEFTKRVKENSATAHIPVILLTALKSENHQKEGFALGADDYLCKPLSIDLLKLKIRNILRTHEHLQLQIREKYKIPSNESAINKHHTEFMDKTRTIIHEYMDDAEFDVDVLSKKMGMSRSGFYRKFRNIAGELPANFIRSERMKTAAKLIVEGQQNMTEIALTVGYTEAANFSRSFKKHFNCPPSKYKEKQ